MSGMTLTRRSSVGGRVRGLPSSESGTTISGETLGGGRGEGTKRPGGPSTAIRGRTVREGSCPVGGKVGGRGSRDGAVGGLHGMSGKGGPSSRAGRGVAATGHGPVL